MVWLSLRKGQTVIMMPEACRLQVITLPAPVELAGSVEDISQLPNPLMVHHIALLERCSPTSCAHYFALVYQRSCCWQLHVCRKPGSLAAGLEVQLGAGRSELNTLALLELISNSIE